MIAARMFRLTPHLPRIWIHTHSRLDDGREVVLQKLHRLGHALQERRDVRRPLITGAMPVIH